MKENSTENKKNTKLPDLDIIDLDDNKKEMNDSTSLANIRDDDAEDSSGEKKSLFSKIYLHIAFLLIVLGCIVFVVYRLGNWGIRVKPDYNPDDINTEAEIEVVDNILPLINTSGVEYEDDGVRTVVLFGNSPFSDDLGGEDNLANIISEQTGAVVYNCAVEGSYLAAETYTFFENQQPLDAFSLYWLTTLITVDNDAVFERAFDALGDNAPKGAKEAYETLRNLDFTKVDVIGIMYDAFDYLDGRPLLNPENHTDIQTVYGNLSASLELLQSTYPHIRIIVMSPTYAHAIDENGEYISSDLHIYNEYPLSTYSLLLERAATSYAVSYVDNFYGTVNELNADQYLTDNLHLNLEGRKKLAERFIYALEYYD